MTQNTPSLLKSYVYPPDYTPPNPKGKYDLVVLGGGTAGLVTAAGAAGLGADVALIEAKAMGGDCLNVGCVPSKALIAGAKEFYVGKPDNPEEEGKEAFTRVMEQVREKRVRIAVHDSVERFSNLGVDVFLGQGVFAESDTVVVGNVRLKYKKAVIATGARASAPPIPGLAETGYLTNENLFELQKRPDRLTVIGAGPIGVEMAQSFQRLGSKVSLVEVAPKILLREDKDAALHLEKTLIAEGVKIYTGVNIEAVTRSGNAQTITMDVSGEKVELASDAILVAAGRKPNTETLRLDTVDVTLSERGHVVVDDSLKTSNSRIYSCGDVSSPYQFTHAADFLARTVIQNALFFGRKKASSLIIPWVTYSSPEIAHVGAYSHELDNSNTPYQQLKMDFSEVDRAVLDDKSGFCEILVTPKKGTILGATIVHEHAGDMISEITVAMQNGISLGKLAAVIHPYPTQAEIIRKLGDAFNRTRLTPTTAKLLKFILKL